MYCADLDGELVVRTLSREGWINNHPVKLGRYPGGEPLVDFRPTQFRPTQGRVLAVLLRPKNLESFMTSLFWIDALVERGHQIPKLVLPYVPGARQDRLNDEGDFLFTAKSVAREINARHFEDVVVLDPHSDVVPALIDRCRVIHSSQIFARGRLPVGEGFEWDAVISPDGGAEKRAGRIAKILGIPLVHGWKTRSIKDGKITGFGCQPFNARRALLVDDICDGGGTFIGLSEAAHKYCEELHLFVTHGLFTQGVDKLFTHFKKIITTDSIVAQHDPRVTVLDACDPLLTGAKL